MNAEKPIYSLDRKAPRMRKGEFSNMVITRKLWGDLRKKFPEYKNKSDKELSELWADISETLRQEVIENPLGVKLGSYTGELKLQYLPHKKELVDHVSSAEEGERIPVVNLVTKGKVAKLKWERRWAVKYNPVLQYYGFQATRELDKMAKEYIDKNPNNIRVSRNVMGGAKIWRENNKFRKK